MALFAVPLLTCNLARGTMGKFSPTPGLHDVRWDDPRHVMCVHPRRKVYGQVKSAVIGRGHRLWFFGVSIDGTGDNPQAIFRAGYSRF